MERETNLLDESLKKMLHVAPEPSLMVRFRQIPRLQYVTGDLDSPAADLTVDLTDIQFPDEHFDIIYCSHVLEHIENDRRAIGELRRVCARDGWALLEVPITVDKTLEDPEIKDPEKRLEVYGQRDHVRRYGWDFVDRLEAEGFRTRTVVAGEFLSPLECERLSITRESFIFCCRPAAADDEDRSSWLNPTDPSSL